MDVLKTVLKVTVAATLIVGGAVAGATVLATNKIDSIGDKLAQELHE